MEHHKISKLSDDPPVSKYVTKKWIEIDYLSANIPPTRM